MRLLANENFPLTSIRILKEAGYDIIAVGQDFAGILDSEVIELATKEQRTILTFDRDYGELIFRKGYQPQAGVIYFRWDYFLPDQPGEYLKNLFDSRSIRFEGMLTVIGTDHIRQRKYS